MPETEAKTTATTEDQLREAIRAEVFDPELGLNIVDIGLVYDITVADSKADITMTLTSPGCPIGPELITDIRRSLSTFDDIDEVDVHLVFSPPWHPIYDQRRSQGRARLLRIIDPAGRRVRSVECGVY